MESVNKTELDFSLILYNTIYDQRNRKVLTKMVFILIYFFFIHSYVAAKKKKEEKIKEKVTMK